MKKDKYERFVLVHKEGSSLAAKGLLYVLVDRETGVNYLYNTNGYSGGITPLLGADGKPIITKIEEENTES